MGIQDWLPKSMRVKSNPIPKAITGSIGSQNWYTLIFHAIFLVDFVAKVMRAKSILIPKAINDSIGIKDWLQNSMRAKSLPIPKAVNNSIGIQDWLPKPMRVKTNPIPKVITGSIGSHGWLFENNISNVRHKVSLLHLEVCHVCKNSCEPKPVLHSTCKKCASLLFAVTHSMHATPLQSDDTPVISFRAAFIA